MANCENIYCIIQTRGLHGNGEYRGNRGNGDHIDGNTAGTGSRLTGLP